MAKKAVSIAVPKKEETVEHEDFLEKVKSKAFDLYLDRERSGIPGDEFGDWLQAESQEKMKLSERSRTHLRSIKYFSENYEP